MKQVIGFLLVIAGLLLLGTSFYHWKHQKQMASQSLVVAQERVEGKQDILSEDFTAEVDETIGVLTIPKLDRSIAIIEGTDERMLAQGVGHYATTAFPGQGEQVLLSGHRDTVFREFGELEVGDRFLVEMPYGSFEYEMVSSEIVNAEDRTVIRKMDQEVLTLSTCYPFTFIGFAPDRYIIYAYPVDEG